MKKEISKINVDMFVILLIPLFAITNVDSQKPAKAFQHGAVAADVTTCSTIGSKILQENGSAVDSYIATVFCLGVCHPMYSGLGGGGVALVYSRQKRAFYSYDYTGSAPGRVFDAKLPENFQENVNKSSRYGKGIFNALYVFRFHIDQFSLPCKIGMLALTIFHFNLFYTSPPLL